MRKPPRLPVVAALAACALLVPASALAQSGGSVQPKIVGGTPASVAIFPWQAAVVDSAAQSPGKDAHQRQFCGGSLLTSRIVVTAGHCVADTDPDCGPFAASGNPLICAGTVTDPGGDGTSMLDPNDVDVVLGRTKLSDAGQGAEMSVQTVKLRDNFDGDFNGDGVPRFDVAYLVLSSPSGQTPIKIAGADEGALWDAGSPEDISGWGSTFDGGSTVDTLLSATVPVIADSTCSGAYGSDFDSSAMVCAGNGAADTCSGDSGGPLEAALQGGGFRLVGLTGWGEGCGDASFPGVYTRVAGPTMSSLIASDVSSIESGDSLPVEPIFGSGRQPRGAAAPSTAAPAANPLKKCKRAHSRKKRRRCVKRVKARAGAAV